MDQLTKLIEQYETENPERKAKDPFFDEWEDDFVNWMAAFASRPTCGLEQRKFLDEVEKFKLKPRGDAYDPASKEIVLLVREFNSDLQKVIKGE